MFWGLIMEPNKRYSQTVESSFHVSMASLDLSTADDEEVQVILCYGDRNYLLCTLKKGSVCQVPLDLNFQEGTKIAFTCNGQGHVHLTGYLIVDEDADEFDKYIDESENEQVEEEEKVNKKVSKRKAAESPKEEKELKRLKQQKITESSDDDDDDLEEDGIDEDDTEDSEDEDDNDEDDSDEDEEDEDDEDEEDEEDEKEKDNEKLKQKKPMKPQPQPQQYEKKKKQVQEQLQQQPQQSKKKHDKQKLTNGKEIKQEQQNKQQKKSKAEQKLQQQNVQNEAKKRVVEGGVLVEERKIGNGAMAQPGKFVAVYSLGRLKNGKKIDSTLEGEGFKFRLGKGEVIKGWDVGIAGMKVGGKRRITIPPNMAYGAQGSPPIIPANSTLIFDIELRKVY